MNGSEKELFRRALAQEQWRVGMDASMRAGISARIGAERRRRERRADRWSWVAAGFFGGLMVAAFVVVTADCWSAMAGSVREMWLSASGGISELCQQLAQTGASGLRLYMDIALIVLGYSLLALWIDVRRARRNAERK